MQLLRTSKDKPLHKRPLWERPDLDHAQLISEFQRECHVVRRSIDGDLVKASLSIPLLTELQSYCCYDGCNDCTQLHQVCKLLSSFHLSNLCQRMPFSEEHMTANSQAGRMGCCFSLPPLAQQIAVSACILSRMTVNIHLHYIISCITLYQTLCCMQTIRDGKSIIIEGLHLDPGLYLYEFGKYGIRHLHTRNDSLLPSQASARQGDAVLVEPVNPEPINPDAAVQQGAELEPNSRYTCSSGPRCTCLFIKTLSH